MRGSLWDAPCRGGALLRPFSRRNQHQRAEQSPAPTTCPRKKVTSIKILIAPSIDGSCSKATSCKPDTSVSGGAYQDARKVSLVWNDIQNIDACLNSEAERTKRVQAPLFSPFFSGKTEKKGPPEATGSCKFATTSQALRASSPGRGAFLSAAAEVTPLQGQRRGRGSRWSRTGPRMCPLFACRSA